jgi:hypothetical protein
MHRTSLMMPERLKVRAERKSRQLGMSLGQFVRLSLEDELAKHERHDPDPLLADTVVYRGPAPDSLSREHDVLLYGDKK